MQTLIWINGFYQTIKPEDKVKSTKNLHSFCVCNGLSDRIVKSQGGYYYITDEGTFKKVFRTLNETSYNDIYKILKDGSSI